METPLQLHEENEQLKQQISHNPCFSGNSFAIVEIRKDEDNTWGHNPCFSGNSFAIERIYDPVVEIKGHNPCFSGNSFAIEENSDFDYFAERSQSLF